MLNFKQFFDGCLFFHSCVYNALYQFCLPVLTRFMYNVGLPINEIKNIHQSISGLQIDMVVNIHKLTILMHTLLLDLCGMSILHIK